MKVTTLLLTIIISSGLLGQDHYGMAKVDRNLWVDQTEITNNEYRQFVSYVRDSIAICLLYEGGQKERKTLDTLTGVEKINWSKNLDYTDNKVINLLDKSNKFFFPEGAQPERAIDHGRYMVYEYNNERGENIETMIYPDTTGFYRQDFFVNYTGELYFWNPFYDDYPVVNINYSQAIAFCHWRTKLYNSWNNEKVSFTLPSIENMYTLSTKSSQLHQEVHPKQVARTNIYRVHDNPIDKDTLLPLETTLPLYWGGLLNPDPTFVLLRGYESEAHYRKKLARYIKKNLYKRNANHKKSFGDLWWSYPWYIVTNTNRCNGVEDGYAHEHPVSVLHCFGVPSSFEDDNNLIHGLSGNVAEILIDKSVVGGSYFHPLEQCEYGVVMEWDARESAHWLGFRCVMSTLENPLNPKPKNQ